MGHFSYSSYLHFKRRRALDKAQKAAEKEFRVQVEELREAMKAAGGDPALWQKGWILKDRGMKGWRKAQKLNPNAPYIDYEFVLVQRPGMCRVCGEVMGDEKKLAVVHRRPLKDGGEHSLENLEVIHTNCQRREVKKGRGKEKPEDLSRFSSPEAHAAWVAKLFEDYEKNEKKPRNQEDP